MSTSTESGSGAAQPPQGEQKTPEQIREEIEHTREELGDTVEALAEKTDVKRQARDRLNEIKGTAQQRGAELAAKVKASSPESASTGAQQLVERVKSNPMPAAIAGALLVGWLLGRR